MTIAPLASNHIQITPDSEVESFFVTQFLESWKNNQGELVVMSGIGGLEPQNKLVLTSRVPVNALPFTRS